MGRYYHSLLDATVMATLILLKTQDDPGRYVQNLLKFAEPCVLSCSELK